MSPSLSGFDDRYNSGDESDGHGWHLHDERSSNGFDDIETLDYLASIMGPIIEEAPPKQRKAVEIYLEHHETGRK